MKKIILISIIFCMVNSNIIIAQMAVTDPGVTAIAKENAITQSQTLTKAIATLAQIKALKERYDQTINNIEKVSSYVRSGKQIKNISHYMSNITHEYGKGVQYVKKTAIIEESEKEKLMNVYNGIIKDSAKDLDYSLVVVNSDKLKMNDFERLNILNSIEDKLKEKNDLLIYLNRKVERAVIEEEDSQKQNDFLISAMNKIK